MTDQMDNLQESREITAEEEAFARATFARIGEEYPVALDPRTILNIAWIYEDESGQHYRALTAVGDAPRALSLEAIEAHRQALGLRADDPIVTQARAFTQGVTQADTQPHTLTLGTAPAAAPGARSAVCSGTANIARLAEAERDADLVWLDCCGHFRGRCVVGGRCCCGDLVAAAPPAGGAR